MTVLSVIIPMYNAERSLRSCLSSVESALRDGMEVIVVDDCSTDRSLAIASEFPHRVIRLEKNSGPATARNRGAEEAKGEYLLFLDADVVVQEDTFEKLLETYSTRPEIAGVSAIYSDKPVLPGLFQEFKAMEETYKYSCYSSDRYSAFDTHCGSIRRDVFFQLGGFNTAYTNADTEDVEFGYKVAENYINCINQDIQVGHHYPGYVRGIRNYFLRSLYWIRLFLARFRFDQAVTTRANAFSVSLAAAVAAAVMLSLWYGPLIRLAVLILILFFVWNIRFFVIAVKKIGWSALPKWPAYLFFLFTLQLAVGAGVAAGLIVWPLRHLMGMPFTPQRGS